MKEIKNIYKKKKTYTYTDTHIHIHRCSFKRLSLGVTWRNIVLGQRDNSLGMGSTVPLGTVPLVVIVIAAIVVKLGSKFAHF